MLLLWKKHQINNNKYFEYLVQRDANKKKINHCKKEAKLLLNQYNLSGYKLLFVAIVYSINHRKLLFRHTLSGI
jgi:hypothetical protein